MCGAGFGRSRLGVFLYTSSFHSSSFGENKFRVKIIGLLSFRMCNVFIFVDLVGNLSILYRNRKLVVFFSRAGQVDFSVNPHFL